MIERLLKQLDELLDGSVQKLEAQMRGVRTNRPTVALVQDLPVEYFGQIVPLKQLGSLSIRPPRDIEVSVWDRAVMPVAMKALESANLGVSLTSDGAVIRVSLPSLTDERRAEFVKLAKRMTEEIRIQLRRHRDEIMKQVRLGETEKQINEDQAFQAKEAIQKAVDNANASVEAMLAQKTKELNE